MLGRRCFLRKCVNLGTVRCFQVYSETSYIIRRILKKVHLSNYIDVHVILTLHWDNSVSSIKIILQSSKNDLSGKGQEITPLSQNDS